MDVIPVRAFTDNYIWMLVDDARQSVLCVDPGEAEPVISFLEQHELRLDAILLTHHHADHIGGMRRLMTSYPDAMVYGPADPRIFPESVQASGRIAECLEPTGTGYQLSPLDETFSLGAWQFRILFIPGHTSTHICYFETRHKLLFCGDTLFSAGCGRVFDGTLQQLHDSLARLKALPDETRVYCGHEYTRQNLRFAATVEPHNQRIQEYLSELQQDSSRCSLPSSMAVEKQINPFLRLDEKDVLAYAKDRACPALDSLSVFRQLREDKNNFS